MIYVANTINYILYLHINITLNFITHLPGKKEMAIKLEKLRQKNNNYSVLLAICPN